MNPTWRTEAEKARAELKLKLEEAERLEEEAAEKARLDAVAVQASPELAQKIGVMHKQVSQSTFHIFFFHFGLNFHLMSYHHLCTKV